MYSRRRQRGIHLIAITVGHAADFELIMYAICGENGPFYRETKFPMDYEPGRKAGLPMQTYTAYI